MNGMGEPAGSPGSSGPSTDSPPLPALRCASQSEPPRLGVAPGHLLAALVLLASGASAQQGPRDDAAPPARAPEIEGARTIHEERPKAQQERIDLLAREAAELRLRLEREAAERTSTLAEVARLDQRLALARADEARARLASEMESSRALAAARRADALESRLAGVRARLAAVLDALYRSTPDDAWRRVLLPERSSQQATASVLAARQVELAKDLAAAAEAARAARAESQARARSASELAAKSSALAAGAAAERDARRRRLAEIAADRSRADEVEADLARAEAGLLDAVAPSRPRADAPRVVAPRTDLPGLASRKGRLPWPLASRARVIAGFGSVLNPRHGTRTLRHGVVLDAPEGAPILAIADGRVVFDDWYKGFGRCVVIDHGAGWLSVCAHARSLDVTLGDDVLAGQQVGEVGDTGSLEGPRLYFQLSKDGEPLDPMGWLGR